VNTNVAGTNVAGTNTKAKILPSAKQTISADNVKPTQLSSLVDDLNSNIASTTATSGGNLFIKVLHNMFDDLLFKK
jgi:hypothetical protein